MGPSPCAIAGQVLGAPQPGKSATEAAAIAQS